MNAQHIVARIAGFEKWTMLLKASPSAMELAKMLFGNMHKITSEEWEFYILDVEHENGVTFDDQDKLETFKLVFANVDGHQTSGYDYRLARPQKLSNEKQIMEPKRKNTNTQISAFPLAEADRKKFLQVANDKFERLLQMTGPRHPQLVRNLWNPEQHINDVLKLDMLPMHRDYAISLIQAALFHSFIKMVAEADQLGLRLN